MNENDKPTIIESKLKFERKTYETTAVLLYKKTKVQTQTQDFQNTKHSYVGVSY